MAVREAKQGMWLEGEVSGRKRNLRAVVLRRGGGRIVSCVVTNQEGVAVTVAQRKKEMKERQSVWGTGAE